jgi:Porin subfamily
MTLIKSILLGSAAAIVAVAGAQAADLPTKKAAPVEQYVKICNVGGITGWTLPGSDTCVKLSGYITAQFEGGNLSTAYSYGSVGTLLAAPGFAVNNPVAYAALSRATAGLGASALLQNNQRVLVANPDTFLRDATGWTTRANFGFDFASNTAYGPLIGHFDINSETGNGFDNVNATYLNTGYLTWAGITAGKAASFYSFTGGGDNWANFFSPDQKGFNEPDLLAYTLPFGGGFSATIAAQSPGQNGIFGASGCGTREGAANGGGPVTTSFVGAGPPGCGGAGNLILGGQRWPDIVGALHVTQGWGEAQVSGVIHNVNARATDAYLPSGINYTELADCGITGDVPCNGQINRTGWGIDAGVKYLLPSFGAGDNIILTGSYTQSAFWYSGLPDAMWGENGQVNGNGQTWYASDAYFNPLTNQWSSPRAWSASALFEHHFTPQFYVDLEGSIGGIHWSNMGGGCYIYGFGCGAAQFANGPLSPSAFTWLIGADIGWNPVTNLNFDLELMYQSTNQTQPSGFIGTWYPGAYNPATGVSGVLVPGEWKGTSSGFAGRLRITRYF